MNIQVTMLRYKTSRVLSQKDSGNLLITTERAITLSEILKDIEGMYEVVKDSDYRYLAANSEIVLSNLRAILD